MKRSRAIAVAALGLSSWVLAGGCSASDSPPASGLVPGSNGGSSVGGTQGMPTELQPSTPDVDGGQLDNLNPLCGLGMEAGTCVPDLRKACRNYQPPSDAVGGAGQSAGGAASEGGTGQAAANAGGAGAGGSEGALAGGGAGAAAGASNEAGHNNAAGGAPSSQGGAGQAGVENAAGQGLGGTSASGGAGGASGGGGGQANDNPSGLSYSCQVTRQTDALTRQCVLAGTGAANAPCFSAADCAPSLACVTEGDAGRCLPYCCDPATACASGTYCAELPLRRASTDNSSSPPPIVPVCVPADDCSLEDPFPCTTKGGCRCKGNTACMVVRDDGTTTCTTPGTGLEGDPCPCAWNHVCSAVTQQCVKVCHTDPAKNECGTQKCQASSELPPNFGVCVGPLK